MTWPNGPLMDRRTFIGWLGATFAAARSAPGPAPAPAEKAPAERIADAGWSARAQPLAEYGAVQFVHHVQCRSVVVPRALLNDDVFDLAGLLEQSAKEFESEGW